MFTNWRKVRQESGLSILFCLAAVAKMVEKVEERNGLQLHFLKYSWIFRIDAVFLLHNLGLWLRWCQQRRPDCVCHFTSVLSQDQTTYLLYPDTWGGYCVWYLKAFIEFLELCLTIPLV